MIMTPAYKLMEAAWKQVLLLLPEPFSGASPGSRNCLFYIDRHHPVQTLLTLDQNP